MAKIYDDVLNQWHVIRNVYNTGNTSLNTTPQNSYEAFRNVYNPDVNALNINLVDTSGNTILLDNYLPLTGGTITGNLSVLGDLTISGNTYQTDVYVEELYVEDNLIILNNGETGVGVSEGYAGLIIDRGSRDNGYMFFNESLLEPNFEFGISGGTYKKETLKSNIVDVTSNKPLLFKPVETPSLYVGASSVYTLVPFIHNFSNTDQDFIINKNISGTTYKYDAGLDTHTYSSDIFTSNNITLQDQTSPNINITSNGTNDVNAGEIIMTESDTNWGFKLRHNSNADSFDFIRMDNSVERTQIRINFSDIIFNHNNNDVDFVIQTTNTGDTKAYKYNAGIDKHYFNNKVYIGDYTPLYDGQLVITDTEKHIRIIGDGVNGAGAEILFGDGNTTKFCGIKEYSDDDLRIHADDTIQLTCDDIGTIEFGSTSALDITPTIGMIYYVTTGQLSFDTGTGVDKFSTDSGLTDASDNTVPTEKAIKSYVDENIPQITFETGDTQLITAVGNTNFVYIIKNKNQSTNIILTPNGSETIDNLSSITLLGYESIDLISDGTNWFIK